MRYLLLIALLAGCSKANNDAADADAAVEDTIDATGAALPEDVSTAAAPADATTLAADATTP